MELKTLTNGLENNSMQIKKLHTAEEVYNVQSGARDHIKDGILCEVE